VDLHKTVSAYLPVTEVVTAVIVRRSAIITGFPNPSLDHAVSADLDDTLGIASVVGKQIPIIALLTERYMQNAVPTDLPHTLIITAIVQHQIPIIARFIARFDAIRAHGIANRGTPLAVKTGFNTAVLTASISLVHIAVIAFLHIGDLHRAVSAAADIDHIHIERKIFFRAGDKKWSHTNRQRQKNHQSRQNRIKPMLRSRPPVPETPPSNGFWCSNGSWCF
jgi:hypothetical protein